jgi:hypothetical protein
LQKIEFYVWVYIKINMIFYSCLMLMLKLILSKLLMD